MWSVRYADRTAPVVPSATVRGPARSSLAGPALFSGPSPYLGPAQSFGYWPDDSSRSAPAVSLVPWAGSVGVVLGTTVWGSGGSVSGW